MQWRKQWHSQQWDLVSRNALYLFKGLIDDDAFTALQSHVIYLRLLRCYSMDDETTSLIDYLFNLYTKQYRTKYMDSMLNYPNHHCIVHLILEVKKYKIPPSLIWTQRFEKRHSLFKALMSRKRGLEWSFREYARSIQLHLLLGTMNDECIYYSRHKNLPAVRFILSPSRAKILTLANGARCLSVQTLQLTSCRVSYKSAFY